MVMIHRAACFHSFLNFWIKDVLDKLGYYVFDECIHVVIFKLSLYVLWAFITKKLTFSTNVFNTLANTNQPFCKRIIELKSNLEIMIQRKGFDSYLVVEYFIAFKIKVQLLIIITVTNVFLVDESEYTDSLFLFFL